MYVANTMTANLCMHARPRVHEKRVGTVSDQIRSDQIRSASEPRREEQRGKGKVKVVKVNASVPAGRMTPRSSTWYAHACSYMFVRITHIEVDIKYQTFACIYGCGRASRPPTDTKMSNSGVCAGRLHVKPPRQSRYNHDHFNVHTLCHVYVCSPDVARTVPRCGEPRCHTQRTRPLCEDRKETPTPTEV